jgi:HK97 family phage prohead protease
MLHDIAQRAADVSRMYRSFTWDEIEIRSDDSNGFTFEGIASVVDHPYPVRDMLGVYTETIKSGAFNKTLKDGSTVDLRWNHQQAAMPFASTTATGPASKLRLAADPNLRVLATLNPARNDVQDFRTVVADGLAREMSIGFMPVPARDKWSADYAEVTRTEVRLIEVSVVGAGANTGGTLATVRSFDEFMSTVTDLDMDEADVRRAIAYFETRLPQPEAEPVNPFAERDRELRDRLARHRLAALTG